MIKYRTALILAAALTLGLIGCAREERVLDPADPAVITLWHSYNAFAKSVFDQKVDRFNDTVGREKGIVLEAYGYGSSDELDKALYDSANHIIGSEPLPNLFIAYPDSAYRLDETVPLLELDEYFSQEELALYRPEFLGEGIWEDGGSPKMLPIAKSTELLFLNGVAFDLFSQETGADPAKLKSWEGIAELAAAYYEWSGGNAFLGFNGFNDFMVMTSVQLGTEPYIIEDGRVTFQYPMDTAKKVWESCYVPHIMGWYESNTFNQDGIKSGKLAAYIGSSAGAGYFPREVVVDENVAYPVECRVLPYPTFEGRPDYMTQRGANLCAFESDRIHEYAAAEFMKWFTSPEQNIEFAVSTGYMPVEKEALSDLSKLMAHVGDEDNIETVKSSVRAALNAVAEKEFYVKKVFSHSYDANTIFSESIWNKISLDLDEISLRVQAGEIRSDVAAEYAGEQNFLEWYESLLDEMSVVLNGEVHEK